MKTMLFAAAAAAALMFVPAPRAHASMVVIGQGNARECYLAAIQGRTDADARETCDTALTLEGLNFHDLVATFVNRGVIRIRAGEYRAALVDFQTAITLRPSTPEAYVDQSAAQIALGDYTNAVASVTRALDLGLAEGRQQALFNRALANEQAGNLSAAYADFQQASQIDPNWPAPRLELARFQVAHRPATAP